jgi:3-hydroxybutyryl-CoA dehydrogenase
MILVLGNKHKIKAFATKISQGNNIKEIQFSEIELYKIDYYEALVDLDFDTDPETRWNQIKYFNVGVFLLGASSLQLGLLHLNDKIEKVFGICNLPGFLERNTLEYTSPTGLDLPEPLQKLFTYEQYLRVEDRVGMISPRIISMVINEAYYTLQEGTASKKDIDLGMKLGTAYPYGPFEWANIIGLNNVYTLLRAVFHDTMDERYKVCNLLKTEALTTQAEAN